MALFKALAIALTCIFSFNIIMLTTGKRHTLNLNPNFTLTYEVKNRSNRLAVDFSIVGNTPGWVAIGLNDYNASMYGADVFMGGVNDTSKSAYGGDYYVERNGPRSPKRDIQQDWTVLNATQSNTTNVTTISFWRFANTSDTQHDVLIQNWSTNLIWSYGSTDDVTKMHANYGTRKVNLLNDTTPGIVIPPTIPTTQAPPRSTTKAGASSLQIGLVALFVGAIVSVL